MKDESGEVGKVKLSPIMWCTGMRMVQEPPADQRRPP